MMKAVWFVSLFFISLCQAKYLSGSFHVLNSVSDYIPLYPQEKYVNATYNWCPLLKPYKIKFRTQRIKYDDVSMFKAKVAKKYPWGFKARVFRVKGFSEGFGPGSVTFKWLALFENRNKSGKPESNAEYRYIRGPMCICNKNSTTNACKKRIPFCDSMPCQNGGTCTNRKTTFFCKCSEKYAGKQCNHYVQNGSTIITHKQTDNRYFIPWLNTAFFQYSYLLHVKGVVRNSAGAKIQKFKYKSKVFRHNGFTVKINSTDWKEVKVEWRAEFGYRSIRWDGMMDTTKASVTTQSTKPALLCHENPCENGGICSNTSTGINFCSCRPGYGGDTCSLRYITGQEHIEKAFVYCKNKEHVQIVFDRCFSRNASKVDLSATWAFWDQSLLSIEFVNGSVSGFVAALARKEYFSWVDGKPLDIYWTAWFEPSSFNTEPICGPGGYCHNSIKGQRCHCKKGLDGPRCENRII